MIAWSAPLTETPEPIIFTLTGEARRAFDVVAARLVRARVIIEIDVLALSMLAVRWGVYRDMLAKRRTRRRMKEIAELRTSIRDLASRFYLLPEDRVNYAVIDQAGEDVELNAIFEFQHPPSEERKEPQ